MKVKVCTTGDVPMDGMAAFEVGGVRVLIANANDAYYAVADTCTHAQGSLSEGMLDVEECTVECPVHSAVFSLRTGEALEFPAEESVQAYPVTLDGENVVIELPDA